MSIKYNQRYLMIKNVIIDNSQYMKSGISTKAIDHWVFNMGKYYFAYNGLYKDALNKAIEQATKKGITNISLHRSKNYLDNQLKKIPADELDDAKCFSEGLNPEDFEHLPSIEFLKEHYHF